MRFRPVIALALGGFLLAGCYECKVNTFQTWCERNIESSKNPNGDPDEAHRPFWAIFYGVKIDDESIRDDFVKFLNTTYLEKVQKRAPRMVWREGKVLHVVNLSNFLEMNRTEFISSWREGIAKAQSLNAMDPADECLWGTIFHLFDSVQIHSLSTDPVGHSWGDSVTSIPTRRREVFTKYGIGNSDLAGWYLMIPPLAEVKSEYPACQHLSNPMLRAAVAQWGIEATFPTSKECDAAKDRAHKEGQTGIAGAEQNLKTMRREPPDSWSWSAPTCDGLSRSKQLAEAVCVSSDDPRLAK